MWGLFAHAAWQVTVVGLVLGAGLPAFFALGVRETVIATGGSGRAPRAPWLHRVLGLICFAVVVIAVLLGIAIIVASGLGKEVSFEHVYPTVVDKS